jgi:NADH-quinone oxidoreductase subunit B
MPESPERRGPSATQEIFRQGGDSFLTTKIDAAIAWGRKYSFFLYPFVTACCGMEFMSAAGPRYDLDRFGAALPRFSPRQADLLMVVGTISHRQAPVLKKVYDQMAEPKWVVAFGACTCSGGPYNNYATVQGIDTIVPVDVYIPGCPPRPEAVIDGLIKLQDRVQRSRGWSRARHRETEDLPQPVIEKPVA